MFVSRQLNLGFSIALTVCGFSGPNLVSPQYVHFISLLPCDDTMEKLKSGSGYFGLEVIKREFILILMIKRNDWLLAET